MRGHRLSIVLACTAGAVFATAAAAATGGTSAAGPALSAIPAAPGETGWTQIDVFQKGINPGSTYTGETRTANFSLWVKNAEGEYVEKEFSLEMTSGKSFNQMAQDFAEGALQDCIDMGFQFGYRYHGNGITVWPTDAGSDPDTEGEPGVYPDNEDNVPKVRKETHPLKK